MPSGRMRFSIVTPSFNHSEFLRRCVASVADQGVELEHIIQDGGSTDGTLDWLRADNRVRLSVDSDDGMYDAINRGLRRATGEICAYLNCDEQYLPGALKAVGKFFDSHLKVAVLFGDFIVLDPKGEYLFHRKVQVPMRNHLWVSHLDAFSCGMFFRRELVQERGILFNPDLRAVGDGDWVLRLLREKVAMASLGRFTSVFTRRSDNLGDSQVARTEAARHMHASAPLWVRCLAPVWIVHHRLRRLMHGGYSHAPFSFEIFTPDSSAKRVRREVKRPRSRWRSR